MKKLYKYIVLLIGILAFSACADEELVGSFGETGGDVILKLRVQTQDNKEIISRSEPTSDEKKLYDLHFYVFNANSKELTGYEKIQSLADGDIISKTANIEIRTKTGNSIIYAVANICEGDTYYLYDDDTENVSDKDKLDLCATSTLTYTTKVVNEETKETEDWYVINESVDVNQIVEGVKGSFNLDDFKNIKFFRELSKKGGNISPIPIDNHYMMSGYLNDGNAVTIEKSDATVSIKEGINVIKLYRILAKNTLEITTNENIVFTPESYTFYNLPRGGKLIPKEGISKANETSSYVTDNNTYFEPVTKETLLEETTYKITTKAKTIDFFYPENIQSSDATINYWEERETNDYDEITGEKSFTKAPLNAAYMEIRGVYVNESENTTANVTYTIHLGHFNANKLNDFNVIRNNHYIYKVTINGVNDIIAEAVVENDNDEDDNPYAEGLVIDTSGAGSKHFEVDAHYEARVMTFTQPENNNIGYILNISTPFGNTPDKLLVKKENVTENGETKTKTFIYNALDTKLASLDSDGTIVPEKDENDNNRSLFNGENDYKWVRFVRNGAPLLDRTSGQDVENTNNIIVSGTESTHTCKYPGDDEKYRYNSNSTGGWLDVFQLLEQLLDNDTYTDSGNTATYTCFIDENYYANKKWEAYVNQDPRTMQIANHVYISKDKKSIYAQVAYSISQHSIATFYTNTGKKAFGTEIIDEEDRYDIRLGSSNNIDYYENLAFETGETNDWSGFSKTKNTNKSRAWYEDETGTNSRTISVVNTNSIESIQPMYLSAAKACMSRNRDIDGDETIDDNEVKWYLASIEQYHALYFAQDVLPEESRFIDVSENGDMAEMERASSNWSHSGHDFRGKYHYYTSSTRSEAGTYWPEEGLTSNDVDVDDETFIQRAELVRCVRTLENGSLNEPGNGVGCPDRYYDFDEVKGTVGNGFNRVERIIGGTFTINSMDAGIRQNISGALPLHNELLEQNKLPKKFQVATTLANTNHNVNTITGQVNDPCSVHDEGGFNNWRTPNQKEVALMLAHMKDQLKSDQCITRTRFSCYDGDDGTESWYDQSKRKFSWHNRVGFKVNNRGNFNLVGTGDSGKIRCVRDVTNNSN